MKKLPLSLSILCLLALTACGTTGADSPAAASPAGASAGSLPAGTQLILGTLKLEGTSQAIGAEQAAELLPLWQTMQVLSESDTAAKQEKEALVTQIQETMTDGQLQAITDMALSPADAMSILQEQGMTMNSGSSGTGAQRGNPSNSSRGFGPGAGGPPGGMLMPPDERGAPGFGGQNMNADQAATAQAARQAAAGSIPPALIRAVIEYLQKKAGS